MIKDPKFLQDEILNYTKKQLLQYKKDGVVLHLDGTLMSLVNVKLFKKLLDPYVSKVIVCVFDSNRVYLKHITTALKELDIIHEIKDLSGDYKQITSYNIAGDDINQQIAFKKRFADLMLNLESDKYNLLPISNLCYSQWILNFPHQCYKNLSYLHPLARLYYGEVKEFARFLDLSTLLIDRKPSHYLYRGQVDEELIGFTYEELESFLRDPSIENLQDRKIQNSIVNDDQTKYLIPSLQRPSNTLG